MKMTVQFVVCDDDGHEETFTNVVVLEKACERIGHLGLTLTEAKQILTALQQQLVERQATAFVAAQAQCDRCGKGLCRKFSCRDDVRGVDPVGGMPRQLGRRTARLE
jgi:hypothetical protein